MKILLLSVIVVLVDQVSKLSVKYFFVYNKPYKIIDDYIRLTYIENPGMAFGIKVDGQLFFTIFASFATIVIFVYIFRSRKEKLALRVALALILGGAIGNLIDRLVYGKVIDFIEIGFHNVYWPIFNIADSAVTIGMVILITLVLFDKNLKKSESQNQIQPKEHSYTETSK